MSELFRLQAVDSVSRRYGSPLSFGGARFWPTVLALALLSLGAISAILFVDYKRWDIQSGVTVLERPPVAVSAPYRSLVTRLFVREGQRVAAGDPLLELRVVAVSDGAQDPISRQREHFERQLAARQEANSLVQAHGRNALSLAEGKIRILNEQVAGISVDLARQREERERLGAFLDKLKDPRFLDVLPQVQILDYESRYSSAASAVSTLERQLLQLDTEKLAAKEHHGKLLTDLAISEAQAKEFSGQHEVDRLSNVMEKGGTIYAATAGIATNILVFENAEVDADEPLLSLVDPASPVVGIIMASGDQAAFLRRGEAVSLRFDSWNYRTRGEVSAEVKELSRVPVHLNRQQLRGSGDTRPLYKVTLAIEQTQFQKVSEGRPLIAGLNFDGVILKGLSPLIDLVLPNWRMREAES